MSGQQLMDDFFASLYAFCGGMKQPVQPEVAAAFNHFVRSFAWLCPAFVDAEEDWGRPIAEPHNVCPFEPVCTIHEFVHPHSFNSEELARKYLMTGVSKDEWGSRLWRLLHGSVSYFSPEELYSVLQACTVLLPCPQCRNHLNQMVNTYIPPAQCCANQYLSDLHNIVNVRIGKPIVGTMTPVAKQISDYLNKSGL